ncbi:MAG: cytidine/deoxycytidylate deaminase family protein [Rickettsiales endosymbiont of Dermacentor nuttalli]
MQTIYNWDSYFMTMAYLIATKSKDPSSKVGAIIVGPDHEVRSTGYNGLPRGLKDTEERYSKPLKYNLINHAEENAILNCSRVGISTKGCSLYVPWIPCSLCTKSIIQAGIVEVIYHEQWPGNFCKESDWAKSIELSNRMFEEAEIVLRSYNGNIIPITGTYQGKTFTLY